jgi:hypothetical protein
MTDYLRDAKLQDIELSALSEQFQDVRARNSPLCDAEYGYRGTDGALVFHFYPPGYGVDTRKDWPDWTMFRDRLEKAMLALFALENIDAGYVKELRSFYLIISPKPRVPDVTALLEHFFSVLEREPEKASGTQS